MANWPLWGPIFFRTPTRTGSEIPDPSWELRKRGHLNSTKSPEWGPFQMIFYYHNRPDLYKSEVTRSARHEDGFAQSKPIRCTLALSSQTSKSRFSSRLVVRDITTLNDARLSYINIESYRRQQNLERRAFRKAISPWRPCKRAQFRHQKPVSRPSR